MKSETYIENQTIVVNLCRYSLEFGLCEKLLEMVRITTWYVKKSDGVII